MRLLLLALITLSFASAQTQVWWRYGGTATRKIVTNVTPGTPPTITSPSHGFTNGTRIICQDIWSIPGANNEGNPAWRVTNATTNTFQILTDASTNVVAPGVYEGGGVCGVATLVTFPAHPYLMLDSGGPNTVYITDQNGASAGASQKVQDNPTWSIWTRMLNQTSLCTTGSAEPYHDGFCNNPYRGDVDGGRQLLQSAVVWTGDKSLTQERTDALNWLNNIDKPITGLGFGVLFDSQGGATNDLDMAPVLGCVKDSDACGTDGEALDSRSFLGETILPAFELMYNEMTSQQRLDFEEKLLGGIMGGTCTNAYEPRTGTISFTNNSLTVTGSGTNFTNALVGHMIFLKRLNSHYTWRRVASVESTTSLTLEVMPGSVAGVAHTATGAPFIADLPWATGRCGMIWSAAHHSNTPYWYMEKRRFRISGAESAVGGSDTWLIVNSDTLGGLATPFLARSGAEIVQVESITGGPTNATATVTRGMFGTTPIAYANNAAFITGSNQYQDGGGFTAGNFGDGTPTVRLGVADSPAHNLTWGHSFGPIYHCMALATVTERARKCAQAGWNYYHDMHFPWYKDMSTMIQSGGTASYITRVTGWNAKLVLAAKNISSGAVDLSDGDWLVKQAYNWGPLMLPWLMRSHWNYTDSASIGAQWDADEYNSIFYLTHLYPDRDEVGWARWHIYNETSPSIFDSFDDRSTPYVWMLESNNITHPNSTSGKKSIDYRNTTLPHVATITTDYTPDALPTSSFPRSGYSNNIENGWNTIFSWSSWAPNATTLWALMQGVGKDHLAAYVSPYNYVIGRNDYLLAEGSGSVCGQCATSHIAGDIAVGIQSDTYRGFAHNEDHSSFGVNSNGSKGTIASVDHHKYSANFSTWRSNGVKSYRPSFGMTRGYRSWIHDKVGSQDYISVFDDFSSTTSQPLGLNLPYMKKGSTTFATWSRTDGDISFYPSTTARINTKVVIVPPTTTYTEANVSGSGGGLFSTRRVQLAEATPTTGDRQWLVVHMACPNNTCTLPTTTEIATISSNSRGVTIADTVPRVHIFDKDGSATNNTLTFTLSGLSANAHIMAKGLTPGTWTGTKNGSSITIPTIDSSTTLELEGHGNGVYSLALSGAAIPVEITTTTLPDGNQNVAYNSALTVTGGTGPYTCTTIAGSLPTGLSFASGCTISGTPTGSGASSFTVQATDSLLATDTQALTLTIIAEDVGEPLTIAGSQTQVNGVLGTAISESCTAAGGSTPYTYSVVGTLPAGVSINSSTGAITGTPTALYDDNVTCRVTDDDSEVADAATAMHFRIQPSGTDFTFQVRPLGTKVILTMRRNALDANNEGIIGVRNASNNDLVGDYGTIERGEAVRRLVVGGLTPSTTYNAEVQVGSFSASVEFTTGTGSGTRTELLFFSVPQGRSIDNVRVEYGSTSALAATPISTTCTTTCSVTLSNINGDDPLYVRHTYRTAANATVAVSPIEIQP